jgi:ubiquinone/menaquinone biosynthesis C-methylase UbiE
MSTPAAAVTPERIMQFTWSFVPPLVLEAAIRHRVFDVLATGPKTVKETMEATGASERGLRTIMNVLVGLDFLAKVDGDRYALTPESDAFLVSSKPGFQGGILNHASRQLIPKWLQLTEIVGTGKPLEAVNEEGPGVEFFQQFVTDIFPMSYPSAKVLAEHLALNGGAKVRVLDLAAGSGVWGIALAQSSENVTVTAVDWTEVLPATRATVARFGLTDRYAFLGGDLLQTDFGEGHNVALLGHILHSEGEARSRALLRKTFETLAPGGTIAIGEFLVNQDRTGPVVSLFFAANMLVNTDHGDTFSFEEISGWLTEAGFTNPRLLEAPGPSPLVLATKV